MTETRLRGTDKGEVVTEALVDGVWAVVPTPAIDTAPLIVLDESQAPASSATVAGGNVADTFPTPRRGRPRKAAA